MILRMIYTLFIGIFLALFVGVGISAFYSGLKYPEMPAVLKYCSSDVSQTVEKFADYKTQAETFNTLEQSFVHAQQLYSRNVSMLAIVGAIILVTISLTFFHKILLLADGLLLGGVITLLYGVVRGFGTEDNMYRFVIVTVGLTISLILGYIKFIRPSQKGAVV